MDWGAYGLFLLEMLTWLVVIIVVLAIVGSAFAHADRSHRDKGRVMVADLSEEWDELEKSMQEALLSKIQLRQFRKREKQREKAEAKLEKAKLKAKETDPQKTELQEAEPQDGEANDSVEEPVGDAEKPRIFVLDFDGDVYANECDELRECITAVLMIANQQDEVLIRLESPGGVVHGYGLASSQLVRIKSQGIKLTVCVDKVAASGGYMMACVADHILSAPFAVIGSVGVIAQLPNFNRLLKRMDVDFEEHTAGEYKRTLTLFGENTDAKREKFKQELSDVHGLFRSHVARYRPSLDIDKIATGEVWHGSHALDLALVDRIATSDEYLAEQRKGHKILQVYYDRPKTLKERLGVTIRDVAEAVTTSLYRTRSGV